MYDIAYSTNQNRYAQYEKQNHSKHNRRCIDGTVTGCNKCVGYCQYRGHPGFLTAKQRLEHDCIGKQCFYYIPKPPKEKEMPKHFVDLSSTILTMVHRAMIEDGGVRVIRVENTEFNQYKAFYITITNEFEFEKYSSQIQSELDIELNFVKLNYDFDKCVALLCAG